MLARFIRAVALLLLAGQAIVVQAHSHAPARWAATTVAAEARTAPSPQRPDDPLTCPVCREVAHGGAYLTPAPVAFSPSVVGELWVQPAALRAGVVGHSSHSWRSRAPPVSLLI